MSIRENRSVMTNAMALRQSSSHPLMCASPILHACRPDEMYTRSVLIYSIIFNTNRESSKMHLYWSWTKSVNCYSVGNVKLRMHRQTDADNYTLRPNKQRSKVRRNIYNFIFHNDCHIENIEVLVHFSTASDLVSSSAKHFVVLIKIVWNEIQITYLFATATWTEWFYIFLVQVT